ncbi:SLC13 family permease [Gaopeijia maritima]|uniref:DASS family sodium-coupled anion symporter n=1 Tax=Gaopeijia maritima TaxID=3119007 RepID=A0ABU9E6M0_9BACT
MDRSYRPLQRFGLFGGPALALTMGLLPPPGSLPDEGWRTAGIAAWMALWWLTEAVAIPVTALLPLVAFPAAGVLDMPDAAAPYASELIFLFMGGFMLAVAMEHHGLHRRIALSIVAAVGTGPNRIVLGFMLATAFLSMWISNTATTAMMLPIGVAVAGLFGARPSDDETSVGSDALGVSLMLGIAYASSIGGVATLIGTPPNAVLAGAASELLGVDIGFGRWMLVGLPVAAVMLPLTWLLLVTVLHPPGELRGDAATLLERERVGLGPRSRGETLVAVVFAGAAIAWILRAPKVIGGVTVPGISTFLPEVRDSTIAMAAALVLFLLPLDLRKGRFVLEWSVARRIPWGVLVLFGGGLSLARAMDRSGLAAWIGGGVEGLVGVPPMLVFLLVAVMFVFLTEVTSNTATATMAMPIMAGAAMGLGQPELPFMATAALAASMAFMLPVATPPNAIVFGSGLLSIQQMARAGLWLNILSIAVVTLAATFLVPLLMGAL